jgi:hypothetical protein
MYSACKNDCSCKSLFQERARELESNNATQETQQAATRPSKAAENPARKTRLALAGWSIEDAVAILPIQPGYPGRIRSVDWIWKTARKAFNYAANAWKSPVKSAREEPANSERPNWLDLSVAFLERTGLGTKGKKIWEQHVAAAEKYARWNKQPGSWSAPYFSCWKPESGAIASKRTWMRKNRLLIETGLLKREQKVPALEDANDLIFGARVAVASVRKAPETRKGNIVQGVGRELDGNGLPLQASGRLVKIARAI